MNSSDAKDCDAWTNSKLKKQESPPAWTQEAYRPPRSHSKSLLFRGGRSLDKKFFSQSEHVSSQIWCQKFFPLLRGGGFLDKIFFSQSEHVSSQIWCQKFFPLLGGGPSTKNFFVSLNMYQAKSGVKNFSLYWDQVPPPDLRLLTPPDLRLGTPPPHLDLGPPHLDLDLGPPTWTWTWDPPTWTWDPPQVNRQTFPSINITFPRTTYTGGNNLVITLMTSCHGEATSQESNWADCELQDLKPFHTGRTGESRDNILTTEMGNWYRPWYWRVFH